MIDYYKDIILENNLSLKRNIEGCNFPISLSEKDSLEIIEKFREIYGDELILLDEIDENTLNKLINAGIITEDSKNKEAVIGFVFKDDYILVINDKDHISINISNFGEEIKLAYERAMEIEEDLDKKFDFSFSPQYGYLTSFGRDCGNGIEIRFKLFLFGLLDNTQAYLTLKSSLAHDGIYLTRYVPEYFKSYDDDIYILKNFGNYRKKIDEYLENFENILDTVVRNERRFRRDFQSLNGLNDEDIKDSIKILEDNLESKNLKTLTSMINCLYDLKKYNILGFKTKLSNQEIEYLIFNITKDKYKGNRDNERYEFLNSYMEAR
ncbi:ATP--guanido phosphotransferase [Anaerococcus vaginalis]|uniref:ATP--guanido phosphotransferase n=1 Tax=Anaerococcus vaginalis TaxID=33037 RepID=UPI00290C9CD2|nr:ATP--guanido phosphotransferase [Anaerococcus vaginalis]MDU4446794.1 ATP--guanido phosphotransferase [Anaerococcus vaginalis]MDU5252312.1 ATP--guanido phosphotransferase [Anaerococcus vaginalis]MDU6781518.1 ATP--guanido phosphotransferase [Anaerococcus vaginalis]MDU7433336.1 ATP--guanido phosphotransferase [Anaerococcus vaginalis]